MSLILKQRSKLNNMELMTMKEKQLHKRFSVADMEQFYALHRTSITSKEVGERFGFDDETRSVLLRYFNTPQVEEVSGGGLLKCIWVENKTE